ncbi:hypothetical protein RHMOL_Rhmol10G0224100 [Rhododendron molle]|uniref:Uncharacterized protein n=1 Tax=Rhododendron molle TaxID=49168 RepID=A0ACC0M634_RHOML|nr:hypothetical protein RHMOL_Rhmol10G0224100 [Rhododendron molle]
MAEHGNSGSEGEVVDRVEDRGGPMEIQTGDQTATEEAAGTSAVVAGGDDGGVNQQQEIGDEENPRVTEENPRARVPTGAVGSISEAEGPGVVTEGSPMVGGSSGGSGSGGAMGGDPGPNGSPPRDPARGKSAVIAEEKLVETEQTTEDPPVEIREQDIAFRPPVTAATSSRHIPITFDEIAEHTPDEILARLLEERPDIGKYVLKAKEDRARAVEAAEAAERAERERKDREEPLRDMESEERAAEEALGPRVTAVAEAGTMCRPDYTSETYVPPMPHLFVPSGISAYMPQRLEYDDETVLRDPLIHIANTWAELWAYEVLRMYPPQCKHPDLSVLPRALKWSKKMMGPKEGRGQLNAFRLRAAGERARGGEGRVRHHAGVPVRGGPPEMSWTIPVTDAQGNLAEIHLVPARVEPPPVTVPAPAEWVNEAVRRMLALENLVRRVAGGFQLELRYPAPTAPQAQRAAGTKPQAQGRATSRSKRTRSPPQKKLAARTPIPAATPQRQTRSSQAAAAGKEPVGQAMARAEERFRIAMRQRPSSEEHRAPKRPKLVLLPTSEDEEEDDGDEEEDEEEEEEEEEHSSARSDSDDSVGSGVQGGAQGWS